MRALNPVIERHQKHTTERTFDTTKRFKSRSNVDVENIPDTSAGEFGSTSEKLVGDMTP